MCESFDVQGNPLFIGDHIIATCMQDNKLHFYEIKQIIHNGNLMVDGKERNVITTPYLTAIKATPEQVILHHEHDAEFEQYIIDWDNINLTGTVEQRQELGPKLTKPEWLYKKFSQ